MKQENNMCESDDKIVIEEPPRPESFATVVVETGQVTYDRPDFVLLEPKNRNLSNDVLNATQLQAVTRDCVSAMVNRHPAKSGNWTHGADPQEDWYEVTSTPVGYSMNAEVETLADAIQFEHRKMFVTQTDFCPEQELKTILPTFNHVGYGIDHAGLTPNMFKKIELYANRGLPKGHVASRRVSVNPEFFTEPELHYVQNVADRSEAAAIAAECNTELRLFPELYITRDRVPVTFESEIVFKMKKQFRSKRLMKSTDSRFMDVRVSVKTDVSLYREKLPRSLPFNSTQKPYTRDVHGKKGFKKRESLPLVREIEFSEGKLDDLTTSEIVQIDTRMLASYIKGVARPSSKDELTQLVMPLRHKGGSVPGDVFAATRLAIMQFCLRAGEQEFYQTLMSYCITGVTTSTKHGTFKGIGFSPKFTAFKQDLGPAYPKRDFKISSPDLVYQIEDAFDRIWEYTSNLQDRLDLNVDVLLSEMMAAHDLGIFRPTSPLLERVSEIDDELVIRNGYVSDARRTLNRTQREYHLFQMAILDFYLRELFLLNSDYLDQKAAEIRSKREKKSKAVLTQEERDALRTTVMRDSCVPFMNVLPPTVSQLRQQGVGGRDMSMVEAADRLLTQANAMLLRISPSAQPIESLTLRQRYVTCHRDGTRRSVVMPANRVLRRVQTRFAHTNDDDHTTVNVDWQPAATWKTIEETDKNGDSEIRMKLSHLGSAKDSQLRSDWFCFPYDPKGTYNYVLDNAFTAVVTIDIDDEQVNLYGIDPANNYFEEIAIDGEIIRDTVRKLMVYYRDSTDWNSDRENVIVDFEDIVNIMEFKPFRNIPSTQKNGDSRQTADFGRYLEDKPNAYDVNYSRAPEKIVRGKKGRTLPIVRNTVKTIRHGDDE
jgi:hypothetical protein